MFEGHLGPPWSTYVHLPIIYFVPAIIGSTRSRSGTAKMNFVKCQCSPVSTASLPRSHLNWYAYEATFQEVQRLVPLGCAVSRREPRHGHIQSRQRRTISSICVWTLPVSASSRPCNALIEHFVRKDSHGHAFKFNMLCIRASW